MMKIGISRPQAAQILSENPLFGITYNAGRKFLLITEDTLLWQEIHFSKEQDLLERLYVFENQSVGLIFRVTIIQVNPSDTKERSSRPPKSSSYITFDWHKL